jgi:streptomycin 6-kinase
MLNDLPKQFIENVKITFGDKGVRWLQTLPDLVDDLSNRWNLSDLKIFNNLSFNFVASARYEPAGRRVVLKCGMPTEELSREIAVLRFYHGSGSPQIIKDDAALGAFLMEQVTPGTPLKSLFPHNETQANIIAAKVITKLHAIETSIPPNLFLDMQQWNTALFNTEPDGPLTAQLLTLAKERLAHILATQTKTVLLHGDLHHDNILSCADHEWVAIDPKGVIGDPAFEIGPFMYNPIPELMDHPQLPEILSQRLTQFSSLLKIDRQRLAHCSFVLTILSACWLREDNNNKMVAGSVRCAELLLTL